MSEDQFSEHPIAKKSKPVIQLKESRKNKICQICGDSSLGFNFGAISCESCKAFFRRNAGKLKSLNCAFDNNCTVDLVTRRFCQKCRLQKCFTAGMKKEWILTESERAVKRKSRTDKKNPLDSGPTASNGNKRKPSVGFNSDPSWHQDDEEEKVHPQYDDFEQKEASKEKQVVSEQNVADYFKYDNISIGEIVNMAISAEYEAFQGPPLSSLNDREQSKLQELFIASRALAETIGEEEDLSFNKFNAEPSLISVINLTELAIKRIIKMAKQIYSFSQLCQEDQVALLKGGCIELMVLRSVMNYNTEKQTWQIPAYSCLRVVSSDVLKEASQLGVNLYEEHLKFASSFCSVWKNDENILLLLSAIALFTPDRANAVHHNVIKKVQDGYFYLLQRYLQTKFAGCQAQEIFLTLTGKLLELHRLNDAHTKLFMEVNPKQIEPLLIEIFDMNKQNWPL